MLFLIQFKYIKSTLLSCVSGNSKQVASGFILLKLL